MDFAEGFSSVESSYIGDHALPTETSSSPPQEQSVTPSSDTGSEGGHYQTLPQETALEGTQEDFWNIPDTVQGEQLLEAYKARFEALRGYFETDAYSEFLAQEQSRLLSEVEQEIQDFRYIYQALQSNPRDFLLQYMPEVLAQHGIEPVLSETEIAQRVSNELLKQFGENYQQQLNPNEIFVPGSYSHVVYRTQQNLYDKYAAMNEQNKGLLQQWTRNVAEGKINTQQQQQWTPEHEQQFLQQQYAETFSQMMQPEEFMQFTEQVRSYQPTLNDMHVILNIENYLTEAYRQGVEEARKGLYGQLKNTGNAQPLSAKYFPPSPSSPQQPERMGVAQMLEIMSSGGMPY